MQLKTKYIFCGGYDPFANQGLEKYLLEYVQPDEIVLYLWQNAHTVVIGKNQNAWQECRVAELEADGGHVARRISGGGAVYHDLGNLNFTFVVHPAHYDIARQQKVICAAVNSLGIQAEITGRNDLTAEGKKFSGNAFYEGKTCFHHGTLMISVATERLGKYLKPSAAKLSAKGVSSVRSRVTNLGEFRPDLDPEKVSQALIRAFGEEYGTTPREISIDELDAARLAQLTAEFADEKWRLGRAIPCDISLSRRFDWGEVELRISQNSGAVTDVQVFTDSMEPALAEQIEAVLRGAPFASAVLAARLRQAGIAPELAALLEEEAF